MDHCGSKRPTAYHTKSYKISNKNIKQTFRVAKYCYINRPTKAISAPPGASASSSAHLSCCGRSSRPRHLRRWVQKGGSQNQGVDPICRKMSKCPVPLRGFEFLKPRNWGTMSHENNGYFGYFRLYVNTC